MSVYDEHLVVVTISNVRQPLKQPLKQPLPPKSPILQKSNSILKGSLPTKNTNSYCTADIP